jgi:hypothetical protein
VNTRVRRGLDRWLPTPFAFDHVIVSARVDGRPVWIDATQSQQGGALPALPPPAFERALLVKSDAEGLTPIPAALPTEPTTEIEETYTLPAKGRATVLSVRTVYRGADADAIRAQLDAVSAAERARQYLNFYAQSDAGVRALHPPKVDDAREDNVVTLTEGYELPDFWGPEGRTLSAWSIAQRLSRPQTTLRTQPLAVEHPVRTRHRLTVVTASPFTAPPDADVGGDAFRITRRSERRPDRLSLVYEYRSLGDEVPASGLRAHLAKIDEADGELAYTIAPPALRALGGLDASPGVSWTAYGVGGLVAALVAAGPIRRWRRRRAYARAQAWARGAAPESAIPVGHPDEIAAALARARCPCGAVLEGHGERSGFRYDGRTMTVVARPCPSCRSMQTRYFDAPFPA